MDRRNFLRATQWACMGFALPPYLSRFVEEDKKGSITVLRIVSHNPVTLPQGNRVPFNWPAIGINPGDAILVKANKLPASGVYWLRVSVAQEIRDEKRLHVSIPSAGIDLGIIEILYSSVLVPYELEIPGKYAELINRNGLQLKLESGAPLWIFSEEASGIDNSPFLPHLLGTPERKEPKKFLDCFTSINSVQSFGWREGAVLDGLWQQYQLKNNKNALKAINTHLGLFIDGNDLSFENGQSRPIVNNINGIESVLPYATVARVHPDHPMLDIAVQGLQQLKQSNGIIMDNGMISAEGCYTVAYPLAVIGKLRNDKSLMQEALDQLEHRFVLISDNAFYLRYSMKGTYTFKNWARGAAWYLLGFARTMAELKNHLANDELKNRFAEAARLAVSLQRKDGLWNCFMDNADSLPDTSGSAGIAAAIATGVRENFLPNSYKVVAENCWKGLQRFITPDGFLKGAAQDNRGGIKLQQSDYRVITQIGMGLMAQLEAEL